MRLTARRLSRLRPPAGQRLLGEPDRQASTIAKRRVTVPPIGHSMPLPKNVVASLRMMLKRHDKSPGSNRASSIPFRTPGAIRRICATKPRYVPEFEKRWNRFACRAGRSWRIDETYVKIKGRWTYLYRAVDSDGNTVDFLLRAKRDVSAAKAFFRWAFKGQGRLPRAITLDGYQASHRAAREFLGEHRCGKRTKLRSSKYLNNLIEQDHRSIKLRLGPMLGFKRFQRVSITIVGIELMHRIRKRQFALGKLRVMGKTAPEIWTVVLAA